MAQHLLSGVLPANPFLSFLPNYFFLPLFSQIGIASGELFLPKPTTTIGRQRRRMHRFEDKMAFGIYQILLRPGETTPQHKHNMVALVAQSLDNSIRKVCPTKFLMAVRLMRSYCKRGIEEQHSLFSPSSQVARTLYGCTQVLLYFLVNILQGRRQGSARLRRCATNKVLVLNFNMLHFI